ncbi:SLC13 family permease [Actinomyces polynesiensis]|uniref:SLC13 family permease n=1 Tax=Actinomyces polynesiensis TaxID=1325934 RepID=UPI002F4106A4
MATPVGTPPNAIALGVLQQSGIRLTFLDWVLLSLPLVLVLLAVAWVYTCALYIPSSTHFEIDTSSRFQTSRKALAFYVVALGTITLWMTEPLHGIASSTVGLIAVVLLLSLRIMDGEDVKSLDWPVLWLVAGGIALGAGVGHTGLDRWIIALVDWDAIPVLLVLLVLAGLAWTISNFVSSTAAANLLVPMGVGIAANVPHSAGEVALVLALACSLGMCLPISAPPNAIAHATGAVPTGAMVRIGLLVGVVGLLLLSFVAPWLWALEGVLP